MGSKLGSVVGAAVGNSKVGAVVGAIAGKVGSYAVGTVGQHYAVRGVEKVLGKSELEQAKEEGKVICGLFLLLFCHLKKCRKSINQRRCMMFRFHI